MGLNTNDRATLVYEFNKGAHLIGARMTLGGEIFKTRLTDAETEKYERLHRHGNVHYKYVRLFVHFVTFGSEPVTAIETIRYEAKNKASHDWCQMNRLAPLQTIIFNKLREQYKSRSCRYRPGGHFMQNPTIGPPVITDRMFPECGYWTKTDDGSGRTRYSLTPLSKDWYTPEYRWSNDQYEYLFREIDAARA